MIELAFGREGLREEIWLDPEPHWLLDCHGEQEAEPRFPRPVGNQDDRIVYSLVSDLDQDSLDLADGRKCVDLPTLPALGECVHCRRARGQTAAVPRRSLQLSAVAKRSIWGFPQIRNNIFAALLESDHSPGSGRFLDRKSANSLSTPGRWTANKVTLNSSLHSWRRVASWHRMRDLHPPCLFK